MRTNIIIVSLVFVLTICAGVLIAGGIGWLRYGKPRHEIVQIEGDVLDAKTVMSKKWLTYEPGKDYFYQCTVQYTTRRGTFPFLEIDTTVIEPMEVWTRKHY